MTATFVGRNVKVALMGLFERINPLQYEENLKGNLFLVFEHDEWLKAVFPLENLNITRTKFPMPMDPPRK